MNKKYISILLITALLICVGIFYGVYAKNRSESSTPAVVQDTSVVDTNTSAQNVTSVVSNTTEKKEVKTYSFRNSFNSVTFQTDTQEDVSVNAITEIYGVGGRPKTEYILGTKNSTNRLNITVIALETEKNCKGIDIEMYRIDHALTLRQPDFCMETNSKGHTEFNFSDSFKKTNPKGPVVVVVGGNYISIEGSSNMLSDVINTFNFNQFYQQ